MRRHCSITGIWCSLLLLNLVPPAHAQTDTTANSTSPAGSCTAAEYRQFDFWIGDWEVYRPDGKPAGTNRISRILDGCVIQENWSGARGSSGTSYSIYDRMRRRWHQTWVDDQGGLLQLDGGFTNASMTLRGETLDSSGVKLLQRITWRRVGPAQVRQLWESSRDGGKTWTVVFDGRYQRRPH
jgi:hypothetical protein